MVLDAAKGIEPQTLKLFEVCRLRDIPIITFINKMDREAQDPFELLDEIASKLAARPGPALLAGPDRATGFKGMVDLRRAPFLPYARKKSGGATEDDGPPRARPVRWQRGRHAISSPTSSEELRTTPNW